MLLFCRSNSFQDTKQTACLLFYLNEPKGMEFNIDIFSVCGKPQWSNDEFCDDENNNAGCNYDGGACCGQNVIKNFCSDCNCREKNSEESI